MSQIALRVLTPTLIAFLVVLPVAGFSMTHSAAPAPTVVATDEPTDVPASTLTTGWD